jgi:tetratricopeptide (TPR) repeat protein
MNCILCKICQARQAVLNEKFFAWLDAQTNSVAIWEREADQVSIHQAHDLLKTDPAESFRQYLALAERGSVWSMANVGQLFENGTGTARDLAQAEKWYLRAYEAGSDYGLIWLGHLYQESRQYEKAQEVFRSGVDQGFVPAMLRLASSYWNSPNWPQRRDEALTLLEHGSAAGDLSARRYLAVGMTRGWFGLRRIPDGIRLVFSTAEDLANLLKDETAMAQSERETRPGLFNLLAARLWVLGATRHRPSAPSTT